MSAPPPARLPYWFQAMLVIWVGGLSTALLFHRVSWSDWCSPHWLVGDPLEVYTRVKIAAEHPGQALFSFAQDARLGAPTGADWSAYPVPDRLVFLLTGLLSRLTGLIAAINLVGALIAGLNAASFYLCARWLRCRWEWAVALGLAFAFCNYNVRWGITLSLSQTFVVPPLILLCAWAGRRSEPASDPRGWKILAAGLGLWLGMANPYLAYFAGVVAGGALLLALRRRNPWSRKIPLFIFLGCLLFSFLAANAAYISQRLHGNTTSALQRNPGDFSVYALRPADWFIPPADHRVPALAKLGQDYHASRRGEGEFFYNYLGLIGAVGLAGLVVSGCRRLARRRWSQLDPLLGLGWIMAFGLAGGFNSWLGGIGLDIFRASTRIGIFAHVWVLFFIGAWITRRSIRLPRLLSLGLAGALTLAAGWEQTPPLGDPVEGRRNQERWQNYAALTAQLERTLPTGAAVFQLPVVPFPEAGLTVGMPDYEHLLPYLTSTTLRFSYGHFRHAPALAWARSVSRRPAAEMVAALEQAGFSVLWLDRRGLADRGQALINSLHGLGLVELPAPADVQPVRIFRLKAAVHPHSPDYADPRLKERWLDEADPAGRPLLLALHGWYAPEQLGANQWRWATREASLGIWWDGAATSARLQFHLVGPATSVVALGQAGREIQQLRPGPQIHEVDLQLNHGLTTLEWRLEGATFKPGKADPRELGFMVENLTVSVP